VAQCLPQTTLPPTSNLVVTSDCHHQYHHYLRGCVPATKCSTTTSSIGIKIQMLQATSASCLVRSRVTTCFLHKAALKNTWSFRDQASLGPKYHVQIVPGCPCGAKLQARDKPQQQEQHTQSHPQHTQHTQHTHTYAPACPAAP